MLSSSEAKEKTENGIGEGGGARGKGAEGCGLGGASMGGPVTHLCCSSMGHGALDFSLKTMLT